MDVSTIWFERIGKEVGRTVPNPTLDVYIILTSKKSVSTTDSNIGTVDLQTPTLKLFIF